MRLQWIDSLKGFGIFLVVLGHSHPPPILSTYIYSFHMPLFFFISGYLFNFTKYANSAYRFFVDRVKSLIVPYFFFEGLACIFYFLLLSMYHRGIQNNGFYNKGILDLIFYIMYSSWPTIPYNDPLWFLTCLFVTEIMFYTILKQFNHAKTKLISSVAVISIIGYLYSVYLTVRLPWGIEVAFTALSFYSAGYLFRNGYETYFFKSKNRIPKICIIIHLLLLVLSIKYSLQRIDLADLKYGNFFIFYLWTFTGIFTYFYAFRNIGSLKVFEYYGKNSLIVLGFHFVILGIIFQFYALYLGVALNAIQKNLFISFIFTVMILVCIVPLIQILNRYFSFFVGRSPRSNLLEIKKDSVAKNIPEDIIK